MTKALLVLFVVGFVASKLAKKSEYPETKSDPEKTEQSVAKTNNPFEMPLKIEEEALTLDSITVIENLSAILNRKNPSRVEIYNCVKDSYEVSGVQCSIEICKNLKYAMRRLKEVSENVNDVAAIRRQDSI